jgi:hypothetical protein
VLQAIKECTDPLGASCPYLRQATGLVRHQVSGALGKLVAMGSIVGALRGPMSRYFMDAAARDAALPLIERDMIERRKAAKKKDYVPRARPSKVNQPLRDALDASTERFGLPQRRLREITGLPSDLTDVALREMRQRGVVFALGTNPDMHYFATAERRDAVADEFPAYIAKVKADRLEARKEAMRRRARERYHNDAAERERVIKRARATTKRKTEERRASKPGKELVRPSKPAPVNKARERWAAQKPITPPGVKVQHLPGCPSRGRFEPPPSFRGEFTNAGIGRYTA